LKRPPANEKAIGAIHRTLAKFTPDDYLVVAGDMDLVIWASYLALSRTNGRLKLLKWNNRLRNYDLICAPDGLTELTKEAA
jgi:hypothetical protein